MICPSCRKPITVPEFLTYGKCEDCWATLQQDSTLKGGASIRERKLTGKFDGHLRTTASCIYTNRSRRKL